MGRRGIRGALCVLLSALPALAFAQPAVTENAVVSSPRFAIKRFVVEGNTLLPAAEIDKALAPYVGPARDFADVQRALETLEGMYRVRGFNTVYVSVPEQALENGNVRLLVVEGRIGTVTVEGNRHFSEANIRASLPMLREGEAPIAMRLSENIQLANENPAKEVQVVLGVGKREGEVDARVRVKDESPYRFAASLDNTGTEATGSQRLGVSFQHNNIADTDQSASFAYTTSPNKPSGVQVDIYSLGYRIPLYRLGDSIDILYANSTVGVPSSSPSLAGNLGIVGKGNIFSARYNWLLPRHGEYASRVIYALDERDMESACTTEGGNLLTGVAGCEAYRVRPLSATYVGRLEQPGRTAGLSLGLAFNTASSSSTSYDLASSGRNAPTSFTLWRAGGSVAQTLPKDWQWRLNGQMQLADKPLVPTEQIGLAGSMAVRGFTERAVVADQGHFVQAELYTPDFAGTVAAPGSLRALAFYDAANGTIFNPGSQRRTVSIASVGLGLRYVYKNNLSWRFDFAHIVDSHTLFPGGDPIDSGWRGHFSLSAGF